MYYSDKETFSSSRPDGRHGYTLAAFMEYLRTLTPALAYPENADVQTLKQWKSAVREKVRELLCMPEKTKQPKPVRLSAVQRDGYRAEKWEFYPDPFSAVPFLVLIPDTASESAPVPGVLCLPGSCVSKELMADEPKLPDKRGSFNKMPERNRMAWHVVQSGMVAITLDNPATAETALPTDRDGDCGANARVQFCHGLAQAGMTYPGYSAFQKLCLLDCLDMFPMIDRDRLAVSAHSLGATDALSLGILCDCFKAIVFNDFVCDDRERYVSITEEDEYQMAQNIGNWHEIFGQFRWFARPDLLCALAPAYLALTEGGAEVHLNKVRDAYSRFGASDHLSISYYPAYENEASRAPSSPIPLRGIDGEEFFRLHSVDAPDHSFRYAPALKLLRCALFGEKEK